MVSFRYPSILLNGRLILALIEQGVPKIESQTRQGIAVRKPERQFKLLRSLSWLLQFRITVAQRPHGLPILWPLLDRDLELRARLDPLPILEQPVSIAVSGVISVLHLVGLPV